MTVTSEVTVTFYTSLKLRTIRRKDCLLDAAFARTGHSVKSDVLIIGDSLTSDIQGSVDYGLDTYWYNPNAEPRPEGLQITYEIRHSRELLEILG